MTFKAMLSCMFVVTGAVVMVPLMCSAWLYHIDPDGIRGWVAFAVASYAWALFTSLCWSVKKWPFKDECAEVEPVKPATTTEETDTMKPVTIKIRKSDDALRFWAVQIGGNGEAMWTTEQYTRLFSAKRAAKTQFERMKKGSARLDLTI